jgi:hypothetical protein
MDRARGGGTHDKATGAAKTVLAAAARALYDAGSAYDAPVKHLGFVNSGRRGLPDILNPWPSRSRLVAWCKSASDGAGVGPATAALRLVQSAKDDDDWSDHDGRDQ